MRQHNMMTDHPNREREATVGLGWPAFSPPPEWTKSAHCLDHPELGPDTWFETGYERQAAAVCNGSDLEGKPCAVKTECLLFALENGLKVGVWGGLHHKPLADAVKLAAEFRAADEMMAKLEAESTCERGHRLTADNLTPKGKCLVCTKDDAVFWRRRNVLVRQGELPPESRGAIAARVTGDVKIRYGKRRAS